MRKQNTRVAITVCVVTILLVGILAFAISFLGKEKSPPLTPNSSGTGSSASSSIEVNPKVTKGPLPDIEAQRLTPGQGQFFYLLNAKPQFPAGDKEGGVYAENMAGNGYPMQVEYMLVNGETIYVSPLIPDGHHLATDKLEKTDLEAGSYPVTARILVYSDNAGQNIVAQFEETITLTVG